MTMNALEATGLGKRYGRRWALRGVDLAIPAARASPPWRVVMLTTFDLDEYVYAALAAGASGFLLKDVPPERLVAAVRQVRDGDVLLAPEITRRLVARYAQPAVRSDRLAPLTDRERDVLELIARGLSNVDIAAVLYLGEETVKTHVGGSWPSWSCATAPRR